MDGARGCRAGKPSSWQRRDMSLRLNGPSLKQSQYPRDRVCRKGLRQNGRRQPIQIWIGSASSNLRSNDFRPFRASMPWTCKNLASRVTENLVSDRRRCDCFDGVKQPETRAGQGLDARLCLFLPPCPANGSAGERKIAGLWTLKRRAALPCANCMGGTRLFKGLPDSALRRHQQGRLQHLAPRHCTTPYADTQAGRNLPLHSKTLRVAKPYFFLQSASKCQAGFKAFGQLGILLALESVAFLCLGWFCLPA